MSDDSEIVKTWGGIAKYLKTSKSTLMRHVRAGSGPAVRRFGGSVFAFKTELIEYMRAMPQSRR